MGCAATNAVTRTTQTISVREARRLALARAGLLQPAWTGLTTGGAGKGVRARRAALAVIERFGYLQLDTVSVAGARSHAIVLLSRLDRMDPELGEALLRAGEPLFEYWGHEASWMPIDLYPLFGFRRRAMKRHPWFGNIVGKHPKLARDLVRRIRDEGPLRSSDMEGPGGNGWWDFKLSKRVATALWSSGELAIRERRSFQRTYDLAERVIPEALRSRTVSRRAAFEALIEKALAGHGWASTGTIAATWRLANERERLAGALAALEAKGRVVACSLESESGRPSAGWIRPEDLELAARLSRARPRADRGVLLSPFDPVLWDRSRVRRLFGFDQVLEIFKPEPKRTYGYYCLPVLAGERLVARVDLKADRKRRTLRVLTCRYESTGAAHPLESVEREAVRSALERYADSLGLEVRHRLRESGKRT